MFAIYVIENVLDFIYSLNFENLKMFVYDNESLMCLNYFGIVVTIIGLFFGVDAIYRNYKQDINVQTNIDNYLKNCSFDEQELFVKQLCENVHPPTRSSTHAAGYDLHSAIDATIPARGKALIPIGYSMAIPEGYYGKIEPRSSMDWKRDLSTSAGVIDSDYRKEVHVVLRNLCDEERNVSFNERIAQMVVKKHAAFSVNIVDELEPPNSDRVGGFGSTGRF